MTDKPSIPPALTASEWAAAQASQRSVLDLALMDDDGYIASVTPERLHALAALALYGQPFGFTQDEALALTDLLNLIDTDSIEDIVELSRTALAKIQALLPPK